MTKRTDNAPGITADLEAIKTFPERSAARVQIALARYMPGGPLLEGWREIGPNWREANLAIDAARAEWSELVRPAEPLDLLLSSLGLDPRAVSALEKYHGAITVRDLRAIPAAVLRATPRLDKARLVEIREACKRLGVPLGR